MAAIQEQYFVCGNERERSLRDKSDTLYLFSLFPWTPPVVVHYPKLKSDYRTFTSVRKQNWENAKRHTVQKGKKWTTY